jgi:hypothetical protein
MQLQPEISVAIRIKTLLLFSAEFFSRANCRSRNCLVFTYLNACDEFILSPPEFGTANAFSNGGERP